MPADYYKILGVSPNASLDDIKKAYKKRAKEWHPDKQSGSSDLFKKLVAAYNVIGNEERRKSYDRRINSPQSFTSRFSNVATVAAKKVMNDFVDEGLFDTLDKFFGRASEPKNIEMEIEITIEELYSGQEKAISFSRLEVCRKCEGSGARSNNDVAICTDCYGVGSVSASAGIASFFSRDKCNSCNGLGRQIKRKCTICKGNGEKQYKRKFSFSIPSDLKVGGTKDRLILPEEGEHGGDLVLTVNMKNHKFYSVSWPNLSVEVPIKFYQAILGDYLEINTLKGAAFFKLPPGTQDNDVITLKGYGLRDVGTLGDLEICVKIQLPRMISSSQRALLKAYKEEDTI